MHLTRDETCSISTYYRSQNRGHSRLHHRCLPPPALVTHDNDEDDGDNAGVEDGGDALTAATFHVRRARELLLLRC
jgi:hypothetical protein